MLARKWRPKNFSELIGQEVVRKTLTNAITQKRIHPALLFTGPRGTGKTSTARIFAKTLRCQNQKNLTPCEKCEDCQTIQAGRSLDVVEIDGASNNGVDAIRDLRDTINYIASSGSYKIYIIDEVHMLSTSAFNALLKTLEEPPEHVIFIMATTAANKIPQTVLSRCQKLDFHLIPPRPLKEQLEKICQGENISIDEEALWLISKQARGSLRDGQSLLDQMVNFCGETITLERITDVLGLTDPSLVSDILKAIIQRSETQMLKNIHSCSIKGGEPDILFQNLIESLRDLLILKLNPKNSPVLVHASEMEIRQLKRLGENSSYEDFHLIFDMLLKAERDLAFCHDKQIALEVLLLRLSQAPRLESITPLNSFFVPSKKAGEVGSGNSEKTKSDSVSQISGHSALNPETPVVQNPMTASQSELFSDQTDTGRGLSVKPAKNKENFSMESGHNGLGKDLSVKGISNKATKKEEISFRESKALPQGSHLKDKKSDNTSVSTISNKPTQIPDSKWFAFVEFVKTKDPKLAALIEALSPPSGNSGTVTFFLPEKMFFLKQIAQPEIHKQLEDLLNSFMKPEKHLQIKFQNSKESFSSLWEQKQDSEAKALMERAASHPFVQTVNRVFKGKIKSVSKVENDK